MSSLAADIEALENRGWQALSGPDGATFYDELMADEGLMVFPGLVLGKVETIRAIAAERPWATFQLSNVRVLEVGGEGAIITYRASSQRPEEEAYHALMSTAYARQGGRWRLILHQQTPIPATS